MAESVRLGARWHRTNHCESRELLARNDFRIVARRLPVRLVRFWLREEGKAAQLQGLLADESASGRRDARYMEPISLRQNGTRKQKRRSPKHSPIDEFIQWYCSEPRLSFNKVVVTRYRIFLENRQLAAGTINGRLAAVRRLAYEAADAGLLSPELVAGIRRVKGAKKFDAGLGNWLTAEELPPFRQKRAKRRAPGWSALNVR